MFKAPLFGAGVFMRTPNGYRPFEPLHATDPCDVPRGVLAIAVFAWPLSFSRRTRFTAHFPALVVDDRRHRGTVGFVTPGHYGIFWGKENRELHVRATRRNGAADDDPCRSCSWQP